MRVSTMKGLAAGSMLGMTLGAGFMMSSRGRRMKRVLMRNGMQMARQVMDCWT